MHTHTCVRTPAQVGRPQRLMSNFDNMFDAFVLVFQIMTLDNWTEIMYPSMNAISPWVAIYYVMVICIGTFTMMQLFLAILLSGMERVRAECVCVFATGRRGEGVLCLAPIQAWCAHRGTWQECARKGCGDESGQTVATKWAPQQAFPALPCPGACSLILTCAVRDWRMRTPILRAAGRAEGGGKLDVQGPQGGHEHT